MTSTHAKVSTSLFFCVTPGTDDDEVILKSFDAFEVNGKIDAEM